MTQIWGIETEFLQVSVDALGVLASGVIAAAGSVIAYRSTYGTRPVAIVYSHGVKFGGAEPDRYNATLQIEIWNNRTYPIQVRDIVISMPGIELISERKNRQESGIYVSGNSASLKLKEDPLVPKSSLKITAEIPFKRTSLDSLDVGSRIAISYFDSISAKHKKLNLRHRYKFH